MVIKVGVNSFGRIGRVIFRTCYENSEIEVSAINDPAIDLEYICYLIKFDSTHGKFAGTISNEGDEIKINDRPVKVFHHKTPADIPWHEAGVQYVVEASGMFTSVEKASGHLSSDGVRRVIVTAPSGDAPMLILGVNEDSIRPDMKVISCASSTLYCLAPIIKILEDSYGVSDGFVTSIHAMTPSLKPLDGLCVRGKHWRDHRSIHQNIIPASTGACRALGAIMPSCRGKLAGLAFRVPVVNGSVLDLTVRLNKDTTIAEISKTIEELSNSSLRNIIRVSNEKAVSSDFAGDTHSCILDIDSSLQIKPNFLKLICWYENEYSYSCRVIDTVLFLERQHQAQISSLTRIMYMRPIYSNLRIDNSRVETNQYVSFCVPNLQNRQHNITPGLQNAKRNLSKSAEIQSPTCQIGRPSNLETKESIKSYIERLTKCKCNEKQNKMAIRRKDSIEDEKRLKAETCFKKVEKEISEMLNMAEELLKKSSSRKIQSANDSKKPSDNKLLENRYVMRKNIIAKISDTLDKIRRVKMNTENPNIIKDRKSSVLDVGNHEDKANNLSKSDGVSLKKSYYKMPLEPTLPNKYLNSNSKITPKKLNSWMIKKYPDSDSHVNTIKVVFPLKEINESGFANDMKSQSIQESKTKLMEGKTGHVNDHKEDDSITVASIVSEKLENTLKMLNVTPQYQPTGIDTSTNNCEKGSESNNSPPSVKSKEFETKDVTKTGDNNSALNIDRNLKPFSKDNMKLQSVDDNSSVFMFELKQEPSSKDNMKQQSVEEVKAMNETKNHNNLKEEILEKVPEINQDYPGCSNSPNNSEQSYSGMMSNYTGCSISKNNSFYKNVEDIFDKLDSESMSDSGSSYRIREKTSQVIKITDLTYSLEDLPRLDKICRVMEISDELSDKLFSSLDNENYENISGRKWSFQDLCERIKFDEFCNELFEKRAS